MESIVSQVLSRGQGNELLNKLEAAGLTVPLAQQVIQSRGADLARRVVRMIMHDGQELSTPLTRAREIMGKSVLGPEELIEHFGIAQAAEQLSYSATVPWSSQELEAVKNTHILVRVTWNLYLADIYTKHPGLFFTDATGAYAHHRELPFFGRIRLPDMGWHLVAKASAAGLHLPWKQQCEALGYDNVVPSAHVIATAIIGHYLLTGERLFPNIGVRCDDVGEGAYRDGRRVVVGYFGTTGLHIFDRLDEHCDHTLGLASEKRR